MADSAHCECARREVLAALLEMDQHGLNDDTVCKVAIRADGGEVLLIGQSDHGHLVLVLPESHISKRTTGDSDVGTLPAVARHVGLGVALRVAENVVRVLLAAPRVSGSETSRIERLEVDLEIPVLLQAVQLEDHV